MIGSVRSWCGSLRFKDMASPQKKQKVAPAAVAPQEVKIEVGHVVHGNR